jgi:hypothetical protein
MFSAPVCVYRRNPRKQWPRMGGSVLLARSACILLAILSHSHSGQLLQWLTRTKRVIATPGLLLC